jgi:hypothetical protein
VAEFCYGSTSIGTNNPVEGASIGIKGAAGGAGDFLEATTGSTNTAISNLVSDSDWPAVNYMFTPAPDTLTFYNMTVNKTGADFNIQTDIQVIGN